MSRLADMEVFVAVAEAGSFTAAADGLRITPSAVSKVIGRLEDRLGTRLLHRTTRRVSLTPEGRAYLDQVRQILADIDAVESSVGGAEAEPRGQLRINVAHGFGMTQIVPIIPRFMARYPKVDVRITFADHVVDLVAEGDDIAIRMGTPGDDSLIARKLGSHARLVCAAPSYLERHGVPQKPADLLHHNCLLFDSAESLNHWPFYRPDGSIERISVRGNFRANSGDALFRLLLDGVGLCYAADFGIAEALREGSLVTVLQDCSVPTTWPIYAVYPARKHLAAKVRVFVDFLVEHFSPTPPWAIGKA
ncbi:MAG TPA: LysR family transcriptional regulator [Ferrovibrio sp.]|jgi:DNA-binding transcriptional LysR family regulator|uniref:LysR family transcriptional regulator n=1 Tax=Ferrovibrio sp. TaxID=1917215 RepID=UPI002B4AE5DD|nr:LysR family transcriptional regulator [Ferrovibrio sp.]HLT76282.1 LysR family transcriptional regulator [Ferrovibrio sp.]